MILSLELIFFYLKAFHFLTIKYHLQNKKKNKEIILQRKIFIMILFRIELILIRIK